MSELAARAGTVTSTRRPHILCADDDSALRFTISLILTRAAYNVTAVKDGAEAWEELQAGRYDLLITDQQMPRLDGVGLVTKARLHGMRLPVILASGSLDAIAEADRLHLGFAAILAKPYNGNELLETVQHTLLQASLSAHEEDLSPLYASKGCGFA